MLLTRKRDDEEDERVLTCIGYTQNISETGLAVVVSARSINESFLDRENCTMEVVLTLPTGCVEIKAVPVRHERLVGAQTNGDEDAPAEQGFIIGMRIIEISDSAHTRYVEYIREQLSA